MRLDKGALVRADQYRSPWVADVNQALNKTIIGNTTDLVFGFYGRQGLNTDAIGLVMKDPKGPKSDTEPSPNEIVADAKPAEKPAQAAAASPVASSVSPAKGTDDLLSQMTGVQKYTDGTYTITRRHSAVTSQPFSAPVTFRFVLMSDGKDFRIGYPADQIIFNWEMRPDELRVDGGPASGNHKADFGRIPAGEWVTLDIAVHEKDFTISVNNVERYRASGDFTSVNKKLSITTRGDLKIKSISLVK
jgi:hypothetical protein